MIYYIITNDTLAKIVEGIIDNVTGDELKNAYVNDIVVNKPIHEKIAKKIKQRLNEEEIYLKSRVELYDDPAALYPYAAFEMAYLDGGESDIPPWHLYGVE